MNIPAPIETVKIVFDGSNIARNTTNSRKANIQNVVIARDYFIENGVLPENIFIVFGSGIRHYVQEEEREMFKSLLKEKHINQAPKGRDDDEFIIKIAADLNAYILTNDYYEDYKIENPDLADFIENHSLRFMNMNSKIYLDDISMDMLGFKEKIKSRKNQYQDQKLTENTKNNKIINKKDKNYKKNKNREKNKYNTSNENNKNKNIIKINKKKTLKTLESASNVKKLYYKSKRIEDNDHNFLHTLNKLLYKSLKIIKNLEAEEVGVMIEEGRITELRLVNQNLEFLPESIGNLDCLSTLNLSKNNIEFLPPSFSNLSQLTELDISKNEIRVFPNALFYLNNLQFLKLHDNYLEEIPQSIANLTEVRELILDHNSISSISSALVYLQNLRQLDLSYNQISFLPKNFRNLPSLLSLNLEANKISDVGEGITQLKTLKILNLNNNPLNDLPKSLFDLESLINLIVPSTIYKNAIELEKESEKSGIVKGIVPKEEIKQAKITNIKEKEKEKTIVIEKRREEEKNQLRGKKEREEELKKTQLSRRKITKTNKEENYEENDTIQNNGSSKTPIEDLLQFLELLNFQKIFNIQEELFFNHILKDTFFDCEELANLIGITTKHDVRYFLLKLKELVRKNIIEGGPANTFKFPSISTEESREQEVIDINTIRNTVGQEYTEMIKKDNVLYILGKFPKQWMSFSILADIFKIDCEKEMKHLELTLKVLLRKNKIKVKDNGTEQFYTKNFQI